VIEQVQCEVDTSEHDYEDRPISRLTCN